MITANPDEEHVMASASIHSQDLVDPLAAALDESVYLIAPRAVYEDPEHATAADTSMELAKANGLAAHAETVPLAGEILQASGLERVDEDDQLLRAGRGGFATLEGVGVVLANASRLDGSPDELQEQLGDEFVVVQDFPISLPGAVSETVRVELDAFEGWPDDSGIQGARTEENFGRDVVVGILDSGVDAGHLEFRGQRPLRFRYVPLRYRRGHRDVWGFDTGNHGTHVSGIVAGMNVGVAPAAELRVASVIESETLTTSMGRVLSGLNWFVKSVVKDREDDRGRPAIVNMSLGVPVKAPRGVDPKEYGNRKRWIDMAISSAWAQDILPVVAAGNDGPGTVRHPGLRADCLTVGAVDPSGNIAPFSGYDGTKPDVVGYGVQVASALERDQQGTSTYGRKSGTSMATPYVSGIAALFRSRDPGLTARQTRALIEQHALPLTDAGTGRGLARYV